MSSARSRSGGIDRRITFKRKNSPRGTRPAAICVWRSRLVAVIEPDVHARVRAVGADALDLASFEEAEEHDLHARAHLADFVEEHRAVGRHFEQPGLVAVRARETAADMAEQLRFEQGIGQPGAVERDERRRRRARCGGESAGRRLPCRRRFHR